MTLNSLSIYNYTDYRLFLRDYYSNQKKFDKNFSHRFVALHVGASSSGWFSDIINDRINLTQLYMVKLCKLLKFKQRESDYFELLVNYGQAESLEQKNRYLLKIFTYKEVSPSLIHREHFEFYTKWYITAIRELLLFYDFSDDFVTLSKQLDPPIKPVEAKTAIEILQTCELIQKNSDGFYKPIEKTITKDSSFKSLHWANFMLSMLKLAMESIERHDKTQRDISSVTVGLSSGGLELAREEIAALRKKLLSLSAQDTAHEKVYQCNFQLFPLTQRLK